MDLPLALVEHRDAGVPFESGGVRSFVRRAGAGDPVVLLHGVPTSSYLYRKVLPLLGAAGLEGVAFDLPGLGFAARPDSFDYTWSGLGSWAAGAVGDLGIDTFHLVVHDIGGPVGLEVASRLPGRVRSLTILNAPIAVDGFGKPWMMRPFEYPGIDRLCLALVRPRAFVALVRRMGVDAPWVPAAELAAYVHQLRLEDGGRAFLRIMKGFETTREKQDLYAAALRSIARRQVVWGDRDPTLTWDREGRLAVAMADTPRVTRLRAKHLVPEDRAPEIAAAVARIVHEG
jgi:haloalkane dehalogenase